MHCTVVSCLFFLLPAVTLLSQDFEVAPVKMFFDCEAGQIQTKNLSVRNHANQKQQFTLTAADFLQDTSAKNKNPNDPAKGNRSCKDWLTLNPSFFNLNPNESIEIKVIMQVPPGHSETRWAMVYVAAADEQTAMAADKQMKSGVKVKPRIGIKVVQSPKSNTNYKGAIGDLKELTQPKDSARTFQARVTNSGDKVIDGKIYLVLSNLETAKEIKEKKPQKVSVYPGNSKTVTLTMPANVPSGKYSLAAILDYGNNSALEAVQMMVEVK